MVPRLEPVAAAGGATSERSPAAPAETTPPEGLSGPRESLALLVNERALEPNTRCPVCLTPIFATTAYACSCSLCNQELRCLFSASPRPPEPSAETRICRYHVRVTARTACNSCGAPVCETCAFATGLGTFCPACMTAGPSRKAVISGTALSIVAMALGILVAGTLLSFEVLLPRDFDAGSLVGVTLLAIVATMTGLYAGLESRDRLRRTSLLPTLAVGLDGVILALALFELWLRLRTLA